MERAVKPDPAVVPPQRHSVRRVLPKLEVGPVDDPLETEADRVAERAMRMPDGVVPVALSADRVSRKCACEDDDNDREILQAKASGQLAGAAPAAVSGVLGSSGSSLDPGTRDFFEPRFQRDFGDVRIHADDEASASALSINALAYTVGSHVAFAHGQYSPGTDSGRHLLAHELAHVVQQTSGADPASRSVRRKPGRWHPENISAGIAAFSSEDDLLCVSDRNITGVNQTCGNYTGKPVGEDTCVDHAEYASACPFPCVGQPLKLRPVFYVDGVGRDRPQPFDPPNLAVKAYFFPHDGDVEVVTNETSTGRYVAPGYPLDSSFSDFTFFTPESPGMLAVRFTINDPSSGEVAAYSEVIPVKDCPLVATDPEPETEAEAPQKPAEGRQTRFTIEVRDPDNAPTVFGLVGSTTPLEGPGGFFSVWQDTTGAYYYLNNGRRVNLPNFSPP